MIRNTFIVFLAGSFLSASGLADEPDLQIGKEKYQETCIACHGEKGKGEFAGIPNFTKKKSVLTKSNDILFTSIVDGLERPGADMAMPPMGANPELTEKEVLDIIAYMQNAFLRK